MSTYILRDGAVRRPPLLWGRRGGHIVCGAFLGGARYFIDNLPIALLEVATSVATGRG